MEEKKREYKS